MMMHTGCVLQTSVVNKVLLECMIAGGLEMLQQMWKKQLPNYYIVVIKEYIFSSWSATTIGRFKLRGICIGICSYISFEFPDEAGLWGHLFQCIMSKQMGHDRLRTHQVKQWSPILRYIAHTVYQIQGMKWCNVVTVRNSTTLRVLVYLLGLSWSLHTTIVLIVTNTICRWSVITLHLFMDWLYYMCVCVWIDYITCMFVYDVAYIGLW